MGWQKNFAVCWNINVIIDSVGKKTAPCFLGWQKKILLLVDNIL